MHRNAWWRWAVVVIVALGFFGFSRSIAHHATAVRAEAAALSVKRAATERALTTLRRSVPAPRGPERGPANSSPSDKAVAEAEELNQRAAARRILLNSWFDRVYRPVIRDALLSPSQVEACRQVVLDHWLRWCDATDVFQQQKLPWNDPVVRKMAREEWQRFGEETKAALGTAAFEQVQQFARTAAAKPAADTVGALVFDSGEPLRADQAAQVMQVLAAASANYANGRAASLDDIDIPTAIARLKDVLTPTQLAALQTTLTARQAGGKLGELLRAAAKPPPPRT